MKGLKLLFAVLLVPLVFQAAGANDEIDTSRAATRRGATTTVSANRQKSSTESNTSKKTGGISRTTDTVKSVGTVRSRTTATPNTSDRGTSPQSVAQRNTVTNKGASKNVSARTTSGVQQRAASATPSSRIITRSATSPKHTTQKTRTTDKSTTRARGTVLSRAASDDTNIVSAITTRNYSACKNVFYECMDEFCANKDATLKRCACSARIHDFDRTKQQLEQVEDKLLDFSQRLLTVNMDKEDAMALNTATEGEIAYAIEDNTKSKKMLDEIAKKLNTSFNNSNFDQGLNAISLSLNTDAAFDNVDSLMGASTTTKSGVDLYNAALPVCREMAMEVCSQSDLSIAESGYQMAIAQDCNTVEKSYLTQNEQARAKIHESSALLDMSRLDIHQKRNSDDILTCKKKMLDMLTDTTVCGTDMIKCLDMTGKYIDPSTGEAVLSDALSELANLIVRPTDEQKWTKVPTNDKFVKFLNSKKIYLEPAMENCQDISTYVWDAFIEDALAQIKLAQDEKLEQVRQSCTTLTTQCLDTATKTINDFDARALSVFGVKADVTINAMCADIRNACTALMKNTDPIIDSDGNISNDWDTGMTEIAATKSYETILNTCREVGKNCIIQACTSIAGNFGLCENIDTSINRKSIISRRACWDEVYDCIADAGTETIAQIMKQNGRTHSDNNRGDIYSQLYGFTDIKDIESGDTASGIATVADEQQTNNQEPTNFTVTDIDNEYKQIYDWCNADYNISKSQDEFDWNVCRLTEQIWGNCEQAPSETLNGKDDTNRIIVNYDTNSNADNSNETLLSWFARNTGTANKTDSCRDTTCGGTTRQYFANCKPNEEFAGSGEFCKDETYQKCVTETETDCITNCFGKSYSVDQGPEINCEDWPVSASTDGKDNHYAATQNATAPGNQVCAPKQPDAMSNTQDAILFMTIDTDNYYCMSIVDNTPPTLKYDTKENGNKTITCSGIIVKIDGGNKYYTPTGEASYTVENIYYIGEAVTYPESGKQEKDDLTCKYDEGTWKPKYGYETCITKPVRWKIKYTPKDGNTGTTEPTN